MKNVFLFTILFFLINIGQAQDWIYKKDKTIQKGKIIEVTVDKIKYQKFEIPTGPTFEIPLSEVIKIKFSNGYVDIVDSALNNAYSKTGAYKSTWNNQFDSTKFTMIYIVFNYGQDNSQIFPIYFNNKYICTLKNHMRLSYKIFSYGELYIERRYNNKIGPATKLLIQDGESYGISIGLPYPQALDPNKRFTLKLVGDIDGFKSFMFNNFYEFKPFTECDLIMQEDLYDPISL